MSEKMPPSRLPSVPLPLPWRTPLNAPLAPPLPSVRDPALAADQKLAEAGHRYNAACAAALAGCGQGEDAGNLDEASRARWRQQALDWLRADLAREVKLADTDEAQARAAVQRTLRHWQQDPDLAGVRDEIALAQLPEPERQPWRKLWADVEVVLVKASRPPPSQPGRSP